MLNRYALHAGLDYYPQGPLGDLRGTYADLAAAKAEADRLVALSYSEWRAEGGEHYAPDWAMVIESAKVGEDDAVVYETSRPEPPPQPRDQKGSQFMDYHPAADFEFKGDAT